MSERDRSVEEAVEGLDHDKREILLRLGKTGAFAAPVVAAFVMQGLSVRPAQAFAGSSSNRAPSDIRLKRDVERIGTHPSGCGIYRFKYLWSDATYIGAIAQDVQERVPGAVVSGPGNYLAVDYGALGMQMRLESGV
jgi:hypothetical protein